MFCLIFCCPLLVYVKISKKISNFDTLINSLTLVLTVLLSNNIKLQKKHTKICFLLDFFLISVKKSKLVLVRVIESLFSLENVKICLRKNYQPITKRIKISKCAKKPRV